MKNVLAHLVSAFLLVGCSAGSSQSATQPASNSSEPVAASQSSPSTSSLASSSSSSDESKDSSSVSSPSSTSFSSDVSSDSSSSSSPVSSSSSSASSSSSIPDVESLDPMGEPYVGRQYYLNHIGDIYSAWDSFRGRGVTIAVIDCGFNPDHEDFFYANGESKVSDLSASFALSGGNVVTSVGKKNVVNMGESHGTFCAGVAAAAINGKGVAGIAPEAELMLLKTDLKPKSIAAAFRYAADNGARVVTISIGSYYDYGGDLSNDGSDLSKVFVDPVKYCYDKGVVVCSAAGNGGLDGHPTEYTFPGAVDHVIGVGGLAANSSGEIWSGSSYNSSNKYRFCDVFAPADGMFGCCHYSGKKYDGGWNGTSFASPIVAGMAALYFEANPEKSNVDFERDLYASCHLFDSEVVAKSQIGYGAVDIGGLLGLTSQGTATLKIQASWANAYVYAWNDEMTKEWQAWPGKVMTKNGNTFTITLNYAEYQNVVFASSPNGQKSVDIRASAFHNGASLNLVGAINENGALVGSFVL